MTGDIMERNKKKVRNSLLEMDIVLVFRKYFQL